MTLQIVDGYNTGAFEVSRNGDCCFFSKKVFDPAYLARLVAAINAASVEE